PTTRATVPKPPATRIERVLAKDGRRPSNMRGSSSYGSRFTSTKQRGKCARIRGNPLRTTPAISSSTKLSSERRSVAIASRQDARKSRGYVDPLWGELNTTGPCHVLGSSTSNGGSSSSRISLMKERPLESSNPLWSERRLPSLYLLWFMAGPQSQVILWFTRYLPGVSLNRPVHTAKGRPVEVMRDHV